MPDSWTLARQEEVFRRFWGLQDVLNKPRKCSTYVTADLASFVRQHKCRRWETLASVAVQYNSDVVALRRLNNLMSDNALRSRLIVFVPGATPVLTLSCDYSITHTACSKSCLFTLKCVCKN